MRMGATAAREMFTVWAPVALIVAAGFFLAYRYVGAPPPRVIRIATGADDGAYHAFAQVILDEGVLNLGHNIPPRDTRPVGTAASLAARQDLHPALVPALLDAATRVRDIDLAILSAQPDIASLRSRLQALESDVASVSVPLAYTGEQYHLRLHLHLLQEELDRLEHRPHHSGHG